MGPKKKEKAAGSVKIRKRGDNWLPCHIDLLIQSISERKEGLVANFSGTGSTKKSKEELWDEIVEIQNASFPTVRTLDQCQGKLRCFKHDTKAKYLKFKNEFNKTGAGGGEDIENYLTESELKILDYIGVRCLNGVNAPTAGMDDSSDTEESDDNDSASPSTSGMRKLEPLPSYEETESSGSDESSYESPTPTTVVKKWKAKSKSPVKKESAINVTEELVNAIKEQTTVMRDINENLVEMKGILKESNKGKTVLEGIPPKHSSTPKRISKIDLSMRDRTEATTMQLNLSQDNFSEDSYSTDYGNQESDHPPDTPEGDDFKNGLVKALNEILDEITEAEWQDMLSLAAQTRGFSLDDRRCSKVYELLTEDDQFDVMNFLSQRMKSNHNLSVQNKMMSMVVARLVTSGRIRLKKTPEEEDKEGQKAISELLKALDDTSNRDSNSEDDSMTTKKRKVERKTSKKKSHSTEKNKTPTKTPKAVPTKTTKTKAKGKNKRAD